jgi:signal transduction histidine kinase
MSISIPTDSDPAMTTATPNGDGAAVPGFEPSALRTFIGEHHSEIITEFSTFARTLMPPGSPMTETELRDHAEELLTAVAEDLGTRQTSQEQVQKSKGLGDARVMAASGRLHADGRIQHGFSVGAVVAEFRALRASVLRQYELTGHTDILGVRRFNESIDEALTESVERFTAQADLYRDQFIGILSHDLRTPLGAITAGASLLARSANDDLRQGRIAARILNSAQRMERMIADLLDLTRTRLGGAIPLKREPTDLRHVCEEVILELRAGHRDAVVRFESHGNVTGNWDADRLAQVVSNLVGNAIEHGSHNPVTLQVREAGERVDLSVHNHGHPIPPEALTNIFEPLARGTSNSTHNLGLGLFIARAIVMAHGGEIRVDSSERSGTTFKVSLPR